MGMSINLRRALLVILTLAGAYTGGWAYFAPHHWYTHFPGFGRSWLPQLGPYNEHLSKDAGAMFLALMVLSLFALHYVRSNRIAQITGLVWLTFNVLHLIYHMQHLYMYDSLDKTLNIVSLGFLVLASAALLTPVTQKRDN
jgi:hypothetical protein